MTRTASTFARTALHILFASVAACGGSSSGAHSDAAIDVLDCDHVRSDGHDFNVNGCNPGVESFDVDVTQQTSDGQQTLHAHIVCASGCVSKATPRTVVPETSCADVVGDGVCDEPQGTGDCEAGKDPTDCSGTEPAVGECAKWCDAIAAKACSADDKSACAPSCLRGLHGKGDCRLAWQKAMKCGATDDQKTCGADGRSVIGAKCMTLLMDYGRCTQGD